MLELDLLRVVAAGAVMIYHFTTWATLVAYPSWLTDITRYGYLGVELFFFVSGYVILTSAKGRAPRRFLASRASRLYPAYLVAMTLTSVVVLVGERSVHPSLGDWAVNLTMFQAFVGRPHVDGVYWTLTAELVFYAVMALALRLDRDLRAVPALLGAWLAIAVVLEQTSGAGRIWLATVSAPFFVAGCCLGLLRRSGATPTTVALLTASLLASIRSVAQLTRETQQSWSHASPTVAAVVTLGSFLLVAAVASGRLARLGRPWMAFAGALSYPVYLLHFRIGHVAMDRFGWVDRWLLLVALVVGVVAASAMVHVAVERPVARARLARRAHSAEPVGAIASPGRPSPVA